MKPARGRVSKNRSGRGGKGNSGGSAKRSGGGGRRRPPKGVSQRPSKVAEREKAKAEGKKRHAEKCEAGRRKKELDEKAAAGSAAAGDAPANDRKKNMKKKKRVRGQKAHSLVVLGAGDHVPIAHGGPNSTDLAPKKGDEEKLPWKTRRMLALIKASSGGAKNGASGESGADGSVALRAGGAVGAADTTATRSDIDAVESEMSHDDDDMECADSSEEAKAGTDSEAKETDPKPERVKFDGMQRGESFTAFKKRLREETKRARFEVERAGNRQREKKRMYYEKRRARAERRARRRAGNLSDDEREDANKWESDGEHGQQSVSLWADMMRDRMDEQRSRKPRRRRDAGSADEAEAPMVRFGERVERPPEFENLPVRPGRRDIGVKPKGNVVVSDAAAILAKN